MELIDKDALVAEIERRISKLEQLLKLGNKKYIETHFTGQFRDIKVYEGIIDFINTLEVKEVDLDEAARKWEDKVYLEKGWQNEYGTPHAPFSEIGNAFREGAKFILKTQKGE